MKKKKPIKKRVQIQVLCRDEAQKEAFKQAAHKAFRPLNSWILSTLSDKAGI